MRFDKSINKLHEYRGDTWFLESRFKKNLMPSTKTFVLEKGYE